MIHRAMRESQRRAAIVIVDFVGSTALKQKADDADWLGRISENTIIVHLRSKDYLGLSIQMHVPAFMYDAVRLIKEKELIRFEELFLR